MLNKLVPPGGSRPLEHEDRLLAFLKVRRWDVLVLPGVKTVNAKQRPSNTSHTVFNVFRPLLNLAPNPPQLSYLVVAPCHVLLLGLHGALWL